MRRHLIVLTLVSSFLASGCGAGEPAAGAGADASTSRTEFWASLQELCGKAFEGRLALGDESDREFAESRLIMHVRSCEQNEIRVPFHVGEDRSRTWVLTRTESGLRLKHDHRERDGSPERVTDYGGETIGTGTAEWQEFPADEYTAGLVPVAATNIWTIEVIPDTVFAYGLRREGTNRRFRVEFDLSRPVAPPPAPWGSEEDPS